MSESQYNLLDGCVCVYIYIYICLCFSFSKCGAIGNILGNTLGTLGT